MTRSQSGKTFGCLYIDDIASGMSLYSGPSLFGEPDFRNPPVDAARGERLWERLQNALQNARSNCDICGIVARSTGCAGALALAEQLPVDRLVLYAPRLSLPRKSTPGYASLDRQARRLVSFARRNLSLCAADVLIIDRDRFSFRDVGLFGRHCRLTQIALRGEVGKEMYTIREIASQKPVSYFLRTGELPKTLAENPEMCIIDG